MNIVFLKMSILFFILLLVYIYVGYPLLLFLLEWFCGKKVKKDKIFPKISIIIAAHNEELVIQEKIANTLELEYPKNKIEIIVASDASTDKTDTIVSLNSTKGIKLIRALERRGKTSIQNLAVKAANGEIIVFTDATTMLIKQSLLRIVENFADPSVGCVGGELCYVNKEKTATGSGGGLYWRYEQFLKKRESNISSLIGVSGCFYAIRKELYEPIAEDLISDFVVSWGIVAKGYRSVYEAQAICFEESNSKDVEEFNMRVRVALRSLTGMLLLRRFLNPFRYGFFSLQLISHKLLRYLVPFFLLAILAINVILVRIDGSYVIFLYGQILFYSVAIFGYLLQRVGKGSKLLNIPFYFCLVNIASFMAIIQFLKGRRLTVWLPRRQTQNAT